MYDSFVSTHAAQFWFFNMMDVKQYVTLYLLVFFATLCGWLFLVISLPDVREIYANEGFPATVTAANLILVSFPCFGFVYFGHLFIYIISTPILSRSSTTSTIASVVAWVYLLALIFTNIVWIVFYPYYILSLYFYGSIIVGELATFVAFGAIYLLDHLMKYFINRCVSNFEVPYSQPPGTFRFSSSPHTYQIPN